MEEHKYLYRGVEMKAQEGYLAFFNAYGGDAGIDAFRKLSKQNLDVVKTVYNIFKDRVDIENNYAKDLDKLSTKLLQATTTDVTTVGAALTSIGATMGEESQQHKEFANAITDYIIHTIKDISKTFEASLKNAGKQIETTTKYLSSKRSNVKALKKKSFQIANEVAVGKKPESAAQKTDSEFYSKSMKAETARIQVEIVHCRTVAMLQSLEKLRLTELCQVSAQYFRLLTDLSKQSQIIATRIQPVIEAVSVPRDLLSLESTTRPSGTNHVDQLLVNFGAEDTSIAMSHELRIRLLQQYLLWAQQCIDNEKKTREDFEKALVAAIRIRDAEDVEATRNQLIVSNAMMDYLQACEWKFTTLMTTYVGGKRPEYHYAKYMLTEKDKNNLPVSILRLPYTVILIDPLGTKRLSSSPNHTSPQGPQLSACGLRPAVTDFKAQNDSQLTIREGDLVNVILAWDPKWWFAQIGYRIGEELQSQSDNPMHPEISSINGHWSRITQ